MVGETNRPFQYITAIGRGKYTQGATETHRMSFQAQLSGEEKEVSENF
jgi:hypothetical protein